MLDQLARDLRLARRGLLGRPFFTAAVVAILGLAIGATTAVFSVVDGLVLRPLPFREPERLVMLWETNAARNRDRNVSGPYNFTRWTDRSRSFESVAAFTTTRPALAGAGASDPARLSGATTTGNLFDTLGATALIGRTLDASDSRPGAPIAIVLSEGLWRSRYAADQGVVGRDVTINGRPAQIVGVMPSSFRFPATAQLWTPIQIDDGMRNARGRWASVVARLRPGVSVAQASDEMARLMKDLVNENPDFNTGWSARAVPLQADVVRNVGPALSLLLGAALFLLLVACANVANLLLTRAIGREREIAIHTAIGATPRQLLRTQFVESGALAAAGAILGLALGALLLRIFVPMIPAEARVVAEFGLDARVALFAVFVTALSALLFGMAPALQQSRFAPASSLRDGHAKGASRGRRRLKAGLVVAEVALSLVLVAGTAVLVRSFRALIGVDPGFRADGVLSAEIDLPSIRYSDSPKATAFWTSLQERLSAAPGVESAAAISWTPLGGGGSATSFHPLDRPAPAPGQSPVGDVRFVTPGLFKTLGIPLVAGRDFDARDAADAPVTVIVNESIAREFWPGKSALGQRIFMEWGRELNAEVIGVVKDAHLASFSVAPRGALFWSVHQVPNGSMTWMVRGPAGTETLGAALRSNVAALDPALALGNVRPLESVLSGSVDRERFVVRLLGGFAALALLLAGVGLYGVLSYAVLDRVPELGVRLALGAKPGDLVRLVVREGFALGALGVAIGVVAALLLAGALEGQLFRIGPRDPLALAVAAVTLVAVAAIAALLPARRATSVDPTVALRST